MEQDLKQRLVGAAVITALAAIFLPMIFDAPAEDRTATSASIAIPNQPGSLARNQMAYRSPSAQGIQPINLPETQILKAHTPSPPSSYPSAAQAGRWFIQVGIFGDEDNAKSLRDTLRKKGFATDAKQIQGDQGLLYRVRVGPELDKSRAEKTKIRLQLNGLKGIIISPSS